MRQDDLTTLPADLPVPHDDGACNHLRGLPVPPILLLSTTGGWVDLADSAGRRTVVYCYPRTGTPDQDPPAAWNAIPGARGCTPQSCAFRDHYTELQALNTEVYGLSVQSTEYQREMAARLHLPFPVLSDQGLTWTTALRLPTFTFEGRTLLQRLTLIIERGRIIKVFYPVFPPDRNAGQVIAWLQNAEHDTSEKELTDLD